MTATRPLALVTGASSGIGLELAKCCAQDGFDLIVAADDPRISAASEQLKTFGGEVTAIEVDLSTEEGVERLLGVAADRPIDALLANAGHGLGRGFLDQDFKAARHVVDTNITGTIYLLHQVGRKMRSRGHGCILVTGSIAGFMPGTFQAVYNGTKAFIDSFAEALRAELADTRISVTCLMPGATDTDFFERADMMDTKVGQAEKDDPAEVAKVGFKAMKEGEGHVVYGLKNKLQAAVAHVAPAAMTAEMHRKMAEPRPNNRQ